MMRQDGASTMPWAVVTGTGGLGFQTAMAIARAGHPVVVAGRNKHKGKAAVEALAAATPGATVRFEVLDLASLASVEGFAATMRGRGDDIGILVNNAGVMTPPVRQTTQDGYELQFGVNHLGHFALTEGLLPLLRPGARVVSVTSLAQNYAKLDPSKLNDAPSYRAGPAYCVAKLLQSMFAVELQRRSERSGWGLTSVAAHPGLAATNLFEGGQGKANLRSLFFTRVVAPLVGQPAAAGALPIIHAALSADVSGGRLYGPKGFMEMKGRPGECSFPKVVHDAGMRTKIWEASERMVGRSFGDG